MDFRVVAPVLSSATKQHVMNAVRIPGQSTPM